MKICGKIANATDFVLFDSISCDRFELNGSKSFRVLCDNEKSPSIEL